MSFKILLITASSPEADALRKVNGIAELKGRFSYGGIEIELLVTGVGLMATSWSMTRWLSANDKPDLAINSGIAGSYKDQYPVGTTVMPVSDCFADAGIEDGENFLTLSEAGLSSTNEFPFRDGLLLADERYSERMHSMLKGVRAITVNTSTGTEATRDRLLNKFNPDIETMEGATFFYICIREKIPFLALRAISNMIERPNKSNWNISLALNNLSEKINEIFLTLD